ncbi:MAG TPA: hypothetical protein VK829_02255 [Terriglobales bacterium]|nr:hypothetical protein [Terriglobales bacterium]
MNKHRAALLDASNQPGYLFFSGTSFHQLYCPKCIYVGEHFKNHPIMANCIAMYVGGDLLRPVHSPPTADDNLDLQNRLLGYRLLCHDKVKNSKFHVSQFRPELCAVAEMLGAAIVDDPELQRGIIDMLKDRDEQARVDRASALSAVVLRAVLFHCHQKDQQKVFARKIAATVNQIYSEEGESLRVGSETVGHALKYLGFCSRRLGNAGRGLVLDEATKSQAHRLGQAYEVSVDEPVCAHCHQLQALQPQGVEYDVQVVKDVCAIRRFALRVL